MADANITTKQCSKCRSAKPTTEFGVDRQKIDGLTSQCKGCRRDRSVEYYAANKERESRRLKDWAQANPGRTRERRRRHYEQNKEKVLEQCRAWRSANMDRVREAYRAYEQRHRNKIRERKRAFREMNRPLVYAKQKAYAEANKSQIRARLQEYWIANKHRLADGRKAYRKANKHIIAANAHKRRARARNAPGKHTAKQLLNLHGLQRSRCAICRTSLKRAHHVDHIVPLAKGGSNDITNIQLLCVACNLSKNAKDPIEFMQSAGFLL